LFILQANAFALMDVQYHTKLWLLGDEDAFKEIFDFYYPRLYRYAFRYLKSEAPAEDLSMEVLAGIWEKKQSIRPETFENYLFTAARNRLINHWQRKIEGLLSLDAINMDEPAHAPAFHNDAILSKELETVYRDSLSALPPQRRLIFQLHRSEHLSYKEIAKRLDISPKTVENQISAALKQLRGAMLRYLASIIL
jgi:RNA polymerase sigma-70 factor (ECF subfamily)